RQYEPMVTPVSRSDQAADSIVRNAVFAGASKLSGAAFTAVLMIFLVRYLGPEEYGVFALALGVGGLMTVPADLGISVSVALFLVARTLGRSIRPPRGGHGHARRILGYGSAIVIVDGAFTIFSQIDVLLIGAILSVTAVGHFDAAYRLAGLLLFIGGPIRSA